MQYLKGTSKVTGGTYRPDTKDTHGMNHARAGCGVRPFEKKEEGLEAVMQLFAEPLAEK